MPKNVAMRIRSTAGSLGPVVLLFLTCTVWGWTPVSLSTGRFSLRKGSVSYTGSSIKFTTSSRRFATVAELSTLDQTREETKPKSIGTLAFLVPSQNADKIPSKFGSDSPVDNPSLLEAAQHLCLKAQFVSDGKLDAVVVPVPREDDRKSFETLYNTDMLIALGVRSPEDICSLKQLYCARRNRPEPEIRARQGQVAMDCAEGLSTVVGPYDPLSPISTAIALLPWTQAASGKRLLELMSTLLERWTSDDVAYVIARFFHQFSGSSIDWVKHTVDATWEKGPARNAQEFAAMVTKCGPCIVQCLQDDRCRQCINKLTEIDSRDQVASYRTIVSFESDLLRDFSQCILTKHNIFQCEATIPTLPQVVPLSTWRGQALTEEDGRAILVAHLRDESGLVPAGLSRQLDVSWKVACGANVAYDQFPSQNQLFYPAARGRDMWYDPVFRVQTLDGRHVWCTRHYKVRPGVQPGTFRLSVLDNGVTSNEFWTIVGAADELSWVVFHYAGAASNVGLRYLGGLLCTPDGNLPDPGQLPAIWDCFRRAGIQPWELYQVDNNPDSEGAQTVGPPPLDFYRSQVLANRAAESAKNA